MSGLVSPIDYEQITLRFRSFLERRENRIAALVCKQWNQIFQPAVWASHSFTRDFNAPEIYKAALQKNAASIRTLRLRNCNSPDTILDLFAPCTRLDALYCELKFELPKDVMPALDLVDNNPRMRTFEIKGIPVKRLGIIARLIQVISEHPGLKRVKYYSNDRKISEHMFIGMLQATPPCQEEFENSWVIRIQDEADGFDFKEEHLVLPKQGWPIHRSLKSIVFDESLAGYEKTVLVPFLQHCPQLQTLQPSTEIPESAAKALFHTIQDYCPKLNELRVKYQSFEAVISSLILGCHQLNIFTMDHGCTMGPAVMAALTYHSKVLTELTIESGTHITSAMIQQVMNICGALKIATFLEVDEEKFVNVLEIKDMVSSEWACQESLESLDFYVGLDYGEQGQDIEARKAMWLRFGHEVIYSHNSEFPLHEDRVDFDMTVATGMDEMKNMKALRCLQVGGMAHRMGMTEVVWIHENWPSLDGIDGLWTWEGEEIDEEDNEELYESKQDAIDWLLEHRPELRVW
ncbi:hypothetical protein BGZ82_000582 [Podila clonocystis]|nr:hypothetical protein BGZ82_000582 [Podila clonocystis]